MASPTLLIFLSLLFSIPTPLSQHLLLPQPTPSPLPTSPAPLTSSNPPPLALPAATTVKSLSLSPWQRLHRLSLGFQTLSLYVDTDSDLVWLSCCRPTALSLSSTAAAPRLVQLTHLHRRPLSLLLRPLRHLSLPSRIHRSLRMRFLLLPTFFTTPRPTEA